MLQIVTQNVTLALQEDIGSGDVTSLLIPENVQVSATLHAREPLLVCGIPWFNEVFVQINPDIKLNWQVAEGEWVDKPTILCEITGPARHILTAERTALNFLQTLSGTATKTYHYVQAIHGTKTRILDTRKTIPGLRFAQKYAVACGGGVNHRFGLYDQFLIKENHIRACGSITRSILAARTLKPDLFLEIEVESIAEFEEAAAASPDRILLDNFDSTMIKNVIGNNYNKIPLEISGGVNLDNIRDLAILGVDYISVGDLTKSVKAIDLSLLIEL